MKFLTRSSILISVFLLGLLNNNLAVADVRVAVASNFLLPAKYIANVYEKETGEKVLISAGSTGKLYAQIINGAPFDVFLAANRREPERLEKEGYAVAGSRFTYAHGRLVLWDVGGRFREKTYIEALKSADYKRISLANPSIAPYGVAALSVLRELKLGNSIENKLIKAENISQAYQYLATGAADIGFIALSQLKANKSELPGAHWLVAEDMHDPILQQAVLLKKAGNKLQAKSFLNYLKSSKAMAMIESFGYGLI